MNRFEMSRAGCTSTLRLSLPLALVVVFTTLVPSAATAAPPTGATINAVGDIEVLEAGTLCRDDGHARGENSALRGGTDQTGKVLRIELLLPAPGTGAVQTMLILCGLVKPAAGQSIATCNNFAATLHGTRLVDWETDTDRRGIDLDELDLELVSTVAGTHATAVTISGTFTRYYDDGEVSTGDVQMNGVILPVISSQCSAEYDTGWWDAVFSVISVES